MATALKGTSDVFQCSSDEPYIQIVGYSFRKLATLSLRVTIPLPSLLSGRNENTPAANNSNKTSRRLTSTKEGLFCHQDTAGAKERALEGQDDDTHTFFAEVVATRVIQSKPRPIHTPAWCWLSCGRNRVSGAFSIHVDVEAAAAMAVDTLRTFLLWL